MKAASYAQGTIVSMESVPCGVQGKSHKRMAQMLCEQYAVRTDAVDYRIRQELPKRVDLLPVGQQVYFRVKQNRMLVRGFTLNGKRIKNQEYVIISQSQR